MKKEELKNRIKFSWKIMFDKKFRRKIVKTINYAFQTQKRARGEGAADVIEFIIHYGDILKI